MNKDKQRSVGHFNLLVDALQEAAYEFCQPCMEYNDMFRDPEEHVKLGCYKEDGQCFVQRWLKLIQDIRNGKNSTVPKRRGFDAELDHNLRVIRGHIKEAEQDVSEIKRDGDSIPYIRHAVQKLTLAQSDIALMMYANKHATEPEKKK